MVQQMLHMLHPKRYIFCTRNTCYTSGAALCPLHETTAFQDNRNRVPRGYMLVRVFHALMGHRVGIIDYWALMPQPAAARGGPGAGQAARSSSQNS
jgi:hypothetical protein